MEAYFAFTLWQRRPVPSEIRPQRCFGRQKSIIGLSTAGCVACMSHTARALREADIVWSKVRTFRSHGAQLPWCESSRCRLSRQEEKKSCKCRKGLHDRSVDL